MLALGFTAAAGAGCSYSGVALHTVVRLLLYSTAVDSEAGAPDCSPVASQSASKPATRHSTGCALHLGNWCMLLCTCEYSSASWILGQVALPGQRLPCHAALDTCIVVSWLDRQSALSALWQTQSVIYHALMSAHRGCVLCPLGRAHLVAAAPRCK